MNTVYTYAGMAVVWILAAVVVFVLACCIIALGNAMIKAVDFMRFHKTMCLRQDPNWRWKRNLVYTYFSAVYLMLEEGSNMSIQLASGEIYRPFNWK